MAAGTIQSRINPPTSVANKNDFSAAKVDDPTSVVKGADSSKTDFKTLITNSMDEVKKERKAKENGDLSAATEEEFLEKLADQTKEKRVPKNELGKDDFLKLFVTQLQNQDPLNPDDGTEMAAKLAQFNGLEQMMNVNKSLEKMLGEQNSARNLQLVNYVGREVTIDGGRVRLKGGEATSSEFNVEAPAAASTLEVRDSAGMLVVQTDLGARNAGPHPLKWDGKSSSGREMPDGIYTYSVTARNVDGNDIPVTMTAKARITGIDVKSEDGGLHSDFGRIKFDQIRSVGRPGFDSEDMAEAAAPAPTASADAGSKGVPTPPPPLAKRAPASMSDELERMKAEGKLQLGRANEASPSGAAKIAPQQSTGGDAVNAAQNPARSGATAQDDASLKKAVDQQRSDSAKLSKDKISPNKPISTEGMARPLPATPAPS